MKVMITDGKGSFGNAILKRFLETDIKEMRLFSRDKKQQDMRVALNKPKPKFCIGDVRNYDSVHDVMKGVFFLRNRCVLF
jgi:UDP-N-acetylglucosamine 4,6-dehydratase